MGDKLTKRTADAATYHGSGRCVVWDSEVTGFGLRVYPSGRRAFVLSYRFHGRKRLLTLGTYGVLTVQQGREAARKALGQIAGGHDPMDGRKDSRRHRVTLKEHADEWLEVGKVKRKSSRDDERRLRKHILPAMGSKPLESITERDCERLHAKVTDRGPVEANRTLELLRLILNAALNDGLIDSNPAARSWRSKRGNRERSRTRYLKRDEFGAFTKAVQEEQNPYVRAVVWLLLLTGALDLPHIGGRLSAYAFSLLLRACGLRSVRCAGGAGEQKHARFVEGCGAPGSRTSVAPVCMVLLEAHR